MSETNPERVLDVISYRNVRVEWVTVNMCDRLSFVHDEDVDRLSSMAEFSLKCAIEAVMYFSQGLDVNIQSNI